MFMNILSNYILFDKSQQLSAKLNVLENIQHSIVIETLDFLIRNFFIQF